MNLHISLSFHLCSFLVFGFFFNIYISLWEDNMLQKSGGTYLLEHFAKSSPDLFIS